MKSCDWLRTLVEAGQWLVIEQLSHLVVQQFLGTSVGRIKLYNVQAKLATHQLSSRRLSCTVTTLEISKQNINYFNFLLPLQ